LDDFDLLFEDPTPDFLIGWEALPGKKYELYVGDSVELEGYEEYEYASIIPSEGVRVSNMRPSPYFVESDNDRDGVINKIDNCVNIPNPDQKDSNNDGVGDACDDSDGDGIVNGLDNCPNIANEYQEDDDLDGIGNVCDDYENRITERLPYLPWIVIGIVGLILLLVLYSNFKRANNVDVA